MSFAMKTILPLSLLAGSALADLHHLFVGSFGTATLYALEFDDQALTLDVANNITAYTSHSWIAFDYQKKNLYGTAGEAWSSYTVNNGTSLTYDTSVAFGGNCTDTKAIFVVASSEPPYNVYGTPFGGTAECGNVLSVDEDGVLAEVVQNYTYASDSGVHGLAFSPDSQYLYSADDSGDAVWTHRIDNGTGELTLVAELAGPSSADPRHIAVHPEGLYAYVIFEGTNELALYTISQDTHALIYTNVTFPLIPDGYSNEAYWSDEVQLSFSNSYLWATSRGRETNSTGYISAFTVDPDGAIDTQLFLTPTTNSGGTANAVIPSPFSDEFVALTDSSVGFVQIWQFTTNTNGSASAAVVATANLDDGGCCANAVWYD